MAHSVWNEPAYAGFFVFSHYTILYKKATEKTILLDIFTILLAFDNKHFIYSKISIIAEIRIIKYPRICH